MSDRFWETYALGETWTSHGRTITEADVANFAGISGDFNPSHLDAAYAAGSAFGARIAHRQLIFSIVLGIAWQMKMNFRNITYGIDRVLFPRPVYLGDTIVVRGTVITIEPYPRKPEYGVVVMRYEAVNQHGDVAFSCDHKMLIEREVSDR